MKKFTTKKSFIISLITLLAVAAIGTTDYTVEIDSFSLLDQGGRV